MDFGIIGFMLRLEVKAAELQAYMYTYTTVNMDYTYFTCGYHGTEFSI